MDHLWGFVATPEKKREGEKTENTVGQEVEQHLQEVEEAMVATAVKVAVAALAAHPHTL